MTKLSKRFWIISLSISAHVVVFTIAFVTNIWRIDRLDAERASISLAVLPPPPAPSGGPAPGQKPKDPVPEKKKVVTETTQPVLVPDKKPLAKDPADDDGNGKGDKKGPGDNPDGDPDDKGTCTGPACGPASAPPAEQPKPIEKPVVETVINVPISMLKGNRIKGETSVGPDDVTKTQMMRDDHKRVVGAFKLCLTRSGEVSSVSTIKSTSYAAYDLRLIQAMRQWVYKPYMVNGTPVPVCSAVSFDYRMQ